MPTCSVLKNRSPVTGKTIGSRIWIWSSLVSVIRFGDLNMTVSSRTPEGMPSECPLCGASSNIEFSEPAQDAPCPNCGHLLWASNQLVHEVSQRYEDALGTSPGSINSSTRFSDLGADSLDIVEMVMDLEEEYDVSIPEDVAKNLLTVRDAVRYIQDQRRGQGR